MKVQEVMSREVETCSPETDLAAAAMIMWRNDCGVVPITGDDKKLVGVITDRDICMAVATKHRPAEDIRVEDVTSKKAHTVQPSDEIEAVLQKMKTEKIRRVPVVTRDGKIAGVVSINDLVLRAEPGSSAGRLSADQVFSVMRSVCEHTAAHERNAVHA